MTYFLLNFLGVISLLQISTAAIPTKAEDDFAASVLLVEYINQLNTSWTATLNSRFHDTIRRETHHFKGCVAKRPNPPKIVKRRLIGSEQLPNAFDARQQWPKCASVREVRDQSNCGSCWAFGATEVMSDRICIASQGKEQPHISADDLLTCCSSCGFGCNGGEPLAAFEYWVRHGLVTGGNFSSKSGCRPYPFPPCDHHVDHGHFTPCPKSIEPTPRCESKCQNGYPKNYADDKFYGAKSYQLSNDVASIQRELMAHGPVEVAFTVYEDFEHYQSGVYHHIKGESMGGHAVRLIGWGVDEKSKEPYWLIANSWNTDWGEQGLFRIRRGSNECGIEEDVTAGLPKTNDVRGLYRMNRNN